VKFQLVVNKSPNIPDLHHKTGLILTIHGDNAQGNLKFYLSMTNENDALQSSFFRAPNVQICQEHPLVVFAGRLTCLPESLLSGYMSGEVLFRKPVPPGAHLYSGGRCKKSFASIFGTKATSQGIVFAALYLLPSVLCRVQNDFLHPTHSATFLIFQARPKVFLRLTDKMDT